MGVYASGSGKRSKYKPGTAVNRAVCSLRSASKHVVKTAGKVTSVQRNKRGGNVKGVKELAEIIMEEVKEVKLDGTKVITNAEVKVEVEVNVEIKAEIKAEVKTKVRSRAKKKAKKKVEELPKVEDKPTLIKREEHLKLWFVIAHRDGKSKVLKHGSQMECMECITKIAEMKPCLKANVYISSGLELIRY